MEDLKGKVILVSGASKGIGAAIARGLGAAGGSVIIHYSSDEAGAVETGRDIPDERKLLVRADLHDLSAAKDLWRQSVDWKGKVDVFVNNAAIMLENGSVDADDETWDEVWNETLQVNVLASARLLRDAVRHFRGNGGGIIVSMSSWAAQRGSHNPGALAYGASKAAVKSLTQSIAHSCARENIFAYTIAPGLVHTQMSEVFLKSQGGKEKIFQGLAMGEWAEPQELGDLVVFLASGKARYLSGATLDFNGASYIR
ncbi:MAG: SDR family oxidoreductase [Rhizobiaceae bacterium]|nr:SDR family oxidoreductase [Rhizobiaceae bacterium]